jgi:hypothetical protein
MVLVLVIGMLFGFWLGRWWGEFRRARYDMRRIWETKRNYRGG